MHICPKCGAREGTKKFVGPFCIDCKYFRIEVPDRIEVGRCKRCGRIRLRGEWMPFSEKKLVDYVKSRFRGEFTGVEFFPGENRAVFTIEQDGAKVEIEKRVNLEMLTCMCPDCNRRAGGYFEAIIQLRGNPGRIGKYAEIFRERLEQAGTFVSKEVQGKDGLDLYVGSTKAVLPIVKRLGLTYGISTTLAGQRQGKRLYRTTFSIRLD